MVVIINEANKYLLYVCDKKTPRWQTGIFGKQLVIVVVNKHSTLHDAGLGDSKWKIRSIFGNCY